MTRRFLTPGPYRALADDFHLSLAVEDHGLVTGAVVGVRTKDGPDGVEGASRQAFADLTATLAKTDLTLADVIHTTTYHVDILANGEAFRRVRDEFFPEPPFPAWAAIGVESLFTPELLVEIVFTARKRT